MRGGDVAHLPTRNRRGPIQQVLLLDLLVSCGTVVETDGDGRLVAFAAITTIRRRSAMPAKLTCRRAWRRPTGSKLVHEWHVFWGLARRMGLSLGFANYTLPSDRVPTECEPLAVRFANAQLPLDEILALEGGKLFPTDPPSI